MKKNLTNEHSIVIIDEQHTIPRRSGNGVLRYFVTVDAQGKLLRYNLAYINSQIYGLDNGRVIGYDNDHDYHHRHCLGVMEPVTFTGYQSILEHFENEWREFHEQIK